MRFDWDKIQLKEDGKIFLLYRHERIFEEGVVKPGDTILDIGGWGMLAKRLEQEGCSVTILDKLTEDQYYPERIQECHLIIGDITTITLFSKYDVVTCFEMLEHCENQLAAVNNIYKHLNTGGLLVGTFPIPGYAHHEDDDHVTFLSKEELQELFETAGFEVLMLEETGSLEKGDEPCSYYFKCRKLSA